MLWYWLYSVIIVILIIITWIEALLKDFAPKIGNGVKVDLNYVVFVCIKPELFMSPPPFVWTFSKCGLRSLRKLCEMRVKISQCSLNSASEVSNSFSLGFLFQRLFKVNFYPFYCSLIVWNKRSENQQYIF